MSSPPDELANLSCHELQKKCRDLKLPSGGSRDVLRKRLCIHNDSNDTGSSKRQKKSPADDLICPITLDLPWNPVMAEDGRIYEKEAIEAHIKSRRPEDVRSPITNEKMGRRLVPSLQHKNLIDTLIENGSIDGDLALKWNKKKMQKFRIEAILKQANRGDPIAMHNVGNWYKLGTHGFKQDLKLAFSWYKKAHTGGSVKATAMLGFFLFYGFGCEISYTKGMMYAGMAASEGSDVGAYLLGMALGQGLYGVPRDESEAIIWLRKALGGSCLHRHLSSRRKKKTQELLSELENSTNEFGST